MCSQPRVCVSRSPRADYKIVAARPRAPVVEAVRHVGFEIQGISFPEQILFAREYRLQTPSFDDDVFLDTLAVRRKLARSGALGDLVANKLDAPPDEARRKQLTLEARLGIAHNHTPLPRYDDDLAMFLHAGELRERRAKPLREPRSDHQRGVLLPALELGDHGSAHPRHLRQLLQR